MDSRVRVLTSFVHEEPDRVPLEIWAREEVWEELKKELGASSEEEVRRELGTDLRGVGVGERHERFLARVREAGQDGGVLWLDERTYENAWGVVSRLGTEGKYEEWVSGPLKDARSVDEFEFPSKDVIGPAGPARERAAELKREFVVQGGVSNPFKRAWQLRGLENFLADLLINKDFARELLAKILDFEAEKARRLVEAGVDVLTITGDIAMQDRLMMSPAAFREMLLPGMARLIGVAKEGGAFAFFHSDGDVSEIVDDLLDAGLDVLNPIQPECMDPSGVKRRWGDRLVLHGGLSIQRTLPFGTEDDVRREVRGLVGTCGRGGGFVLCPSNMIQFDTPVRNVLAVYDEAKKLP